MALRVRRYRPADGQRVAALHEAAMRDAGWYSPDVPDDDLDDVEGYYLECGGEFLVGELDGTTVAMGALAPAKGGVAELFEDLREPAAEVTRMRVDPDHQGRGYGRRIYGALEGRAREAAFRELYLDTDPDRESVRGFYESLGYTHERTVALEAHGEAFDLALYRKRLE